jgi:phosphoribosylamine---glycine ligase
MQEHGISTAAYRVFTAAQKADARSYGESVPLPVVVKADGLAAGKGVLICTTREEVRGALDQMFAKRSFGHAGNIVVIEEYLEGEEASVFAVTDGRDFITLAPAQDHKRVFDGDRGSNTGGMGAYAPAPVVTQDVMRVVEKDIIRPTLDGMFVKGTPYRGCLYVGLMLTADGPKVVEYNCRFGDPEAQVVLPLYRGDLVDLLLASSAGTVARLRPAGGSPPVAGSAVCVVLASEGYPDHYETGLPIEGLEQLAKLSNVVAFHAGTELRNGTTVTSGGRVLGITAIQQEGSLQKTIDTAFQAVRLVSFAGMHYRHDIGRRAIVH